MKYNDCDFYVLIFCGLTLVSTYDNLSYQKSASQSHTAAGPYFDANNAVDRNLYTCMRTQDIGISSPYKTTWWKVDLGGVYNIYSVNIFFKNYQRSDYRQRGRFAGFFLYVSTTGDIQGSTLCYKDGPQLPPLNFTTICIEHGRYVIFYNERRNEVSYPTGYEMDNVYTELCEVIVKGCSTVGLFGINCDRSCPTNCKDNICHIVNGTCFGCKPGWTGILCNTECGSGWYGDNCSRPCVGHCRDGATCNHVTGQCDGGCDAGWAGYLCEKACDDGAYGYDCVNNCSGHCLNDYSCNKQTGHCDKGCYPGYTNGDCSKRCLAGYFGLNCRERCSGQCINNEPCHNINGVCPNGCRYGYIGTHCNNSCKEGYYGTNCSDVCSPNCKTCRHTDSFCTCMAGWMGHNCTTECSKSYGENCSFKCSVFCINQTCDKLNGNCLISCSVEEECDTDNIKIAETKSSVSSWTIAFSITIVICFIFISTTFIMLWRYVLKRKHPLDCVQRILRPKSIQEGKVVTDEVSYYQELNVSKEENTYQTLELH